MANADEDGRVDFEFGSLSARVSGINVTSEGVAGSSITTDGDGNSVVRFELGKNSGWNNATTDSNGMQWEKLCITFTATAEIEDWEYFAISNRSGYISGGSDSDATYGNVNHGLALDDISITAVPEPSSTALLGLGALGLIVRRKR